MDEWRLTGAILCVVLILTPLNIEKVHGKFVSTYAQHVSITLGQRSSNGQIALLFVRTWPIYDVLCKQCYSTEVTTATTVDTAITMLLMDLNEQEPGIITWQLGDTFKLMYQWAVEVCSCRATEQRRHDIVLDRIYHKLTDVRVFHPQGKCSEVYCLLIGTWESVVGKVRPQLQVELMNGHFVPTTHALNHFIICLEVSNKGVLHTQVLNSVLHSVYINLLVHSTYGQNVRKSQ